MGGPAAKPFRTFTVGRPHGDPARRGWSGPGSAHAATLSSRRLPPMVQLRRKRWSGPAASGGLKAVAVARTTPRRSGWPSSSAPCWPSRWPAS